MSSAYKVGLDGKPQIVDDAPPMYFQIWDLGPSEPVAPTRPKPPKGDVGEPEHDLAMIDFKRELAAYETGLETYGRQKREYLEWNDRFGGPYQIAWLSPDAREAMQNDPKRYVEKLAKGVKPGKWQAEQEARLAQAERDMKTLAARDPVFGLGLQGAPA